MNGMIPISSLDEQTGIGFSLSFLVFRGLQWYRANSGVGTSHPIDGMSSLCLPLMISSSIASFSGLIVSWLTKTNQYQIIKHFFEVSGVFAFRAR